MLEIYADKYKIVDHSNGKRAIACQFGHIVAQGSTLIAIMPVSHKDQPSLVRARAMRPLGLQIHDGSNGRLLYQFQPTAINFAKVAAILKPLPHSAE